MNKSEQITDFQKWGSFPLNSGAGIRHLQVGDLNLWLQRKDDEIWLGHTYSHNRDKSAAVQADPPANLEWSRWAPQELEDSVSLLPVFPDLPLVVNSEFPLRVTPRSSIKIYTRIPVWLRINMGKTDMVLAELPTVKLSRTWFGTPMEGELCYWATTKARRSLDNVEKKSHLVSCPIQITNKTEEDLDFDKFCLRVERLKIFAYQEDLWADETRIVYQGEDQHSDITMSGQLPKGMEGAKLVAPPRKPLHRSLATRTFRKIFDDSFMFGK